MCRLLHVEWRCTHKQNIWEYCRDATAPSRTPSNDREHQPCAAFVEKYGADLKGPTDDEYRNFCCKFACCLKDQADVYKQVMDLEAALGMKANESLPHRPSFLLSRQQKSLKNLRKKFQALAKRHEERCEALFYGLGVVDGSDAYRAPAKLRKSEDQPHSSAPEEGQAAQEITRDQNDR
ncbi:hypothetical protein Q7P37_009025 [Cladosporium fusiforme]